MAEERETLLRVEHLCQYFGVGGGNELKAVDDVSFDIKKGEVFGLVGESGCGKTTTGRTIIKLYNATSGNVWFKGRRIVSGIRSYKNEIRELTVKKRQGGNAAEIDARIAVLKEEIKKAKHDQRCCDKDYEAEQVALLKDELAQKLANVTDEDAKKALQAEYKKKIRIAARTRLVTQIQMIFQDPIASLDPRMTIRDIIAEGLIIQGHKDQAYIDEEVYKVLEMVGLVREHAGRYPHEFSGGQRQRVGIARSIIMKPDLIIADEPVSALDVSIQAQVINLLNDLRNQLGLTILFIAHDLSVVKYFSDRIGVMYFGKMVELASSDELFKHPLHPYTKSLLSAIPLPDPHYEKQRKRITYNPIAEHDYSQEQPTLREVCPGHFVRCNSEELKRYQEQLKNE